jgi:hypothetical protein
LCRRNKPGFSKSGLVWSPFLKVQDRDHTREFDLGDPLLRGA